MRFVCKVSCLRSHWVITFSDMSDGHTNTYQDIQNKQQDSHCYVNIVFIEVFIADLSRKSRDCDLVYTYLKIVTLVLAPQDRHRRWWGNDIIFLNWGHRVDLTSMSQTDTIWERMNLPLSNSTRAPICNSFPSWQQTGWVPQYFSVYSKTLWIITL